MSRNIFTELQTEYDCLSRVEKKVADFILANPQSFTNASMTELSAQLQVSQGSIHNFSKKFSDGGFSALKLKVAGSVLSQSNKPFTVIDSEQGVISAMKTKIREADLSFQNTLEMNEEAVLKRVVDKILAAKKIELYGVFQSGIVASDFCLQLIQLGIPANFINDTLTCAISASMLDENSLVIAISSSGATKEIIDAVELAKKNHVPIIGLTAYRFSPLAKLSDELLLSASSGMSISDKGGEIRLSQMLIVDTVCSYLRSAIDESGKKHYYKLREILNSHSIQD